MRPSSGTPAAHIRQSSFLREAARPLHCHRATPTSRHPSRRWADPQPRPGKRRSRSALKGIGRRSIRITEPGAPLRVAPGAIEETPVLSARAGGCYFCFPAGGDALWAITDQLWDRPINTGRLVWSIPTSTFAPSFVNCKNFRLRKSFSAVAGGTASGD